MPKSRSPASAGCCIMMYCRPPTVLRTRRLQLTATQHAHSHWHTPGGAAADRPMVGCSCSQHVRLGHIRWDHCSGY